MSEIDQLRDGGTLAVLLGTHALRMGFRATLYTFNLKVFDPSWFASDFAQDFHKGGQTVAQDLAPKELVERLKRQKKAKKSRKLGEACDAYINYLNQGGQIRMEDFSLSLIRRHLQKQQPILTGLSSTYLYHCHREYGDNLDADDVRGVTQGHFVVLTGFHLGQQTVTVSDPYLPNPKGEQVYKVPFNRLAGAIFLGVLTYDANLLVIDPTVPQES